LVRVARTPEPVEHEPYTVRISPFYIDPYEVTYEEYCKFVSDGNKKYATGGIRSGDDGTYVPPRPEWARFPVRGANYYHARGYAQWAGKRLPSEAEWEFAHSGTEHRTYPWGNDEPNEKRANFGPTLGGLKPVGSFPAGKTPEGVFDLAGNIGEWCNDFYDDAYYCNPPTGRFATGKLVKGDAAMGNPIVDPKGPESGFLRVYRLGCQCRSATPEDLHANLRCSASPFRAAGCVGFRCARSGP
ncbi:MAG TPA: formylglycine-generating enzyme family protein, partial [Thermoguttaceae bacterium]|nr:formylglycine-generating enzyme family protein [Thermoguttaceae bacterium]